jgi:hypothetical protein
LFLEAVHISIRQFRVDIKNKRMRKVECSSKKRSWIPYFEDFGDRGKGTEAAGHTCHQRAFGTEAVSMECETDVKITSFIDVARTGRVQT